MKTATVKTTLPAGVQAGDLKYDWKTRVLERVPCAYVKMRDGHNLWVVRTLHIANGRAGQRSYAMGVDDGKVYRVGNGPHVLREVMVYVTAANQARLKTLVERLNVGQEAAGQIRDRISTRRARGQLMRAEGRTYWRW